MSNEKPAMDKKFLISLAVIAVLIAAIIVLLLRGCYTCSRPCTCASSAAASVTASDIPLPGAANEGHLPGMSKEEVMSQMQKEADESYFSFKINSAPVFESPESEGNLEIENPSYNTYPIAVKIYRDDTGELIYDSGLILPNHFIQNAPLNTTLPSGGYVCTADILIYSSDASEYLGKSQAGIKITIL